MYPLKFKPIYVEKIWAGAKLKKLRPNMEEKNVGISWEVSGHKTAANKIINGVYKGLDLIQLVERDKVSLLGTAVNNDQILRAAYLDASDDLSIQVHPDDEYGKKVENDGGKCEAWYIIDAEEKAYITAGINVNHKEEIRQAFKEENIEKYLVKIPVKKGDLVVIPAGLLHALGKGILAIEIGQNSNITYRFYDYNRGRKLDVDNAFAVLDPNLKCIIGNESRQSYEGYTICYSCIRKEFMIDIIDIGKEYVHSTNGERYYVYSCVDGECQIEYNYSSEKLSLGESIFIPASIGEYRIKGKCRLLRSYIPKS